MSRRKLCQTHVPAGGLWAFVILLSLALAPTQAADKPPAGKPAPPPASAAAPAATPSTPVPGVVQAESDPVLANVDGHPIRLSELGRASESLPENLRDLPFDTLYPVLLERLIDHQALVMMARRQGLDEVPAVKQDIEAAVERVLESAYLGREAMSKVTGQAIQTRYNQQFGNRPATEEARGRHILLATEAEANDVIAELRKGADFATLAASRSKDPDGKRGGDLGFFRREQVWPAFADVAFSLSPGQIGPTPIHNEFGWHVVKVEERRLVAPPSLTDVRETLRQELASQAVRAAVKQARSQLPIHQFNLDGSVRNVEAAQDAVAPR